MLALFASFFDISGIIIWGRVRSEVQTTPKLSAMFPTGLGMDFGQQFIRKTMKIHDFPYFSVDFLGFSRITRGSGAFDKSRVAAGALGPRAPPEKRRLRAWGL